MSKRDTDALEKLLKQRSQLNAKISRKKAAIRTKSRAQARKDADRRKYVLGGAVLALAEDSPNDPYLERLASYIIQTMKDGDRYLFDMDALEEAEKGGSVSLAKIFPSSG